MRSERDAQLKHFDSLDQKAGILLGFAGALVALSPTQANLAVDIGRGLAVLAASAALSAFWPRTYPVTNLRVLRNRYLAANPAFTLQRILDTQISMTEATSRSLEKKARRLKIAMATLAIAATVVAAGLVIT